MNQLLAVTSEYGASCGDRLGLGANASITEMLPVVEQRMCDWYKRADEYWGSNRETITAAKILACSYEKILFRVQKAKVYLYL